MKPIIFVRIADMKYYRGVTDDDSPYNGGSYVRETGQAHECYNFDPVPWGEPEYGKCLGYVAVVDKQLHIEKITGCELMKNEKMIEGVYVVFVSKAPGSGSMRVVGFYKNATVYRDIQNNKFSTGYVQYYRFKAEEENCVLLPYMERHRGGKWFVPASSSRYNEFGFGRSNVWYAGSKGASEKEIAYVNRMIESIESYQGENLIYKEVQ